ncbi:hypothetical protein [Allorhodopirellula solitaria]|uniref:Uncharacterized protein n=1 Tax=Allorhodopirellula solitaria TaxID=2527987 RepID=A0A5C5XRN5_9BACT|nr:hypothetical protein [Allorhodopirellula solitaria]TWT65033.1 hypothetical protein CA85_33780 [Allorhodopirellula solitaria]
MIAPLVEHVPESSPRRHAAAIRRAENQPSQRISRFVEKQPAAVIAVAVAFGIGVGWLVKRKKWSS